MLVACPRCSTLIDVTEVDGDDGPKLLFREADGPQGEVIHDCPGCALSLREAFQLETGAMVVGQENS